ncbi:Small subunit processome complex component [Fusarium oxysporum f. sp. albedinis]|nr:Small subunit processome complex component [Fusarium oxysporum f. sp. albedinis]
MIANAHTIHTAVATIPAVVQLAISTTCQVVGRNGMRALWIVFGIMVIASAVFALRSSTIVMSRRLYHVITTLITIISALSYFAMASGHAAAFICQTIREDHKPVPNILRHVCREVFWARFVDSSLTIPLLLLELCLLAGVDGAHTLMAIVAVLVMVLSGLFAAFGCDNTAQTWGWFAIACFSYLFVIWHVAVHGSQTVDAKGAKVTKLFSSMATFILILWTIYLM